MAFPKFIQRLIGPAIKAVQAATNAAIDRVVGDVDEDAILRPRPTAAQPNDERLAAEAAAEFARNVAAIERTTASVPTPPEPPSPSEDEDGDLLDQAAAARTAAPKPPPPTVPQPKRGTAQVRHHPRKTLAPGELSDLGKAHYAVFLGESYEIVQRDGMCAIKGCPARHQGGSADLKDDNGRIALCRDGVHAVAKWRHELKVKYEFKTAKDPSFVWPELPSYWHSEEKFEEDQEFRARRAKHAAAKEAAALDRRRREEFAARVTRMRWAIVALDFPLGGGNGGRCDTGGCDEPASEWRLFTESRTGRSEYHLCATCGKATEELRFQMMDVGEPVTFFIFRTPEKAATFFENRVTATFKRAESDKKFSRPQAKVADLMPNPYKSARKSTIGQGKKAAKEARRAAKAAEQTAKETAERALKKAEELAKATLSEEEELQKLEAEDAAKKARDEAELRVLEAQVAALDAAEQSAKPTNGKLTLKQQRKQLWKGKQPN